MNKFIISSILAVVFLSSCSKGFRHLTSYDDDMYFDPHRDKSELKAEWEKTHPKQETSTTKVANQGLIAATKADSMNPYYQDKDYDKDDYYDYSYASRLRRFHSPLSGVGYYDSYYTNSYFYNQNPYQYGVSIYNGYSFWGQSYNNYSYVPNYNWSNGYGYGTNYNYNPYGYYDPYNAWGNNYYNPYGYGYGNYYNNYGCYNNGFGSMFNGNVFGLASNYVNSNDYNSYYYGPRQSHSSNSIDKPEMPNPTKFAAKTNNPNEAVVADPTDVTRFQQTVIPTSPQKNTLTKGGSESITPTSTEEVKPRTNPYSGNTNNSNPTPINNTPVVKPSGKNNTETSAPETTPSKPTKKWNWGGTETNTDSNNGNSNGGSYSPRPVSPSYNPPSKSGGNESGGSTPSTTPRSTGGKPR